MRAQLQGRPTEVIAASNPTLTLMKGEDSPKAVLCLCGSGKKAKRCHESDSPPLSADRLKIDKRIDETLWSLTMNVSESLKRAIEAMTVSPADIAEGMYRICLSFHARKMYRATLAGLTLVRFSQSTQALTLKREQYYSWASFHYYLENRRDAILFVASQPLRQRDKALERAELHPELKHDPEWQQELKTLDELCRTAYHEFSGLRRAKGKSGKTSNPKMIDWPEPNILAMLRAIVKDWPSQLASMGEPVAEGDIEAWMEREVRRVHFYHGDFMSQDVHGTPMAIGGTFTDVRGDSLGPVKVDTEEPNGLIYIYLWYPFGVLSKLIERFALPGFKDRLIKLERAAMKYREVYGD
jgi:hypothetical protein